MEVFVARQPIFDHNLKVFGYEILFRNQDNISFQETNGDSATASVISNTFHLMGIEKLTGGRRAFINFTRNLLTQEIATILPKDLIAVEILENVNPDAEVIEACRKLKEKGYLLVLDDFIFKIEYLPLLKLVDIIKIDFLETRDRARWDIIKKIKEIVPGRVSFLAEKVETREDFQQAVDAGYRYFQGYFFSKPVTIAGKDIPGHKITYLRILRELNQPEPDLNRIEKIIIQDMALSYKLLRFINSALFGFRQRIKSIKHAIVLLGIKEFKKWFILNMVREIGNDKPDELIRNSMIRARFAELLASLLRVENISTELFMMGMFSLIDVILERPLLEILDELAISSQIKRGLLGQDVFLNNILKLICAYERGVWDKVFYFSEELKLDYSEIPAIYFKALEWAHQIYKRN